MLFRILVLSEASLAIALAMLTSKPFLSSLPGHCWTYSQDILPIASAPPRLAYLQRLSLLRSYLYLLPHTIIQNSPGFRLQPQDCPKHNCSTTPPFSGRVTAEFWWEIPPLVDSRTSLQLQMVRICWRCWSDIWRDPRLRIL